MIRQPGAGYFLAAVASFVLGLLALLFGEEVLAYFAPNRPTLNNWLNLVTAVVLICLALSIYLGLQGVRQIRQAQRLRSLLPDE